MGIKMLPCTDIRHLEDLIRRETLVAADMDTLDTETAVKEKNNAEDTDQKEQDDTDPRLYGKALDLFGKDQEWRLSALFPDLLFLKVFKILEVLSLIDLFGDRFFLFFIGQVLLPHRRYGTQHRRSPVSGYFPAWSSFFPDRKEAP